LVAANCATTCQLFVRIIPSGPAASSTAGWDPTGNPGEVNHAQRDTIDVARGLTRFVVETPKLAPQFLRTLVPERQLQSIALAAEAVQRSGGPVGYSAVDWRRRQRVVELYSNP
jgi:hypothetical protein